MTQAPRKPFDDEIDVYGLTHPGKVRPVNEDHFLLAAIHKRIRVLSTSLSIEAVTAREDRLAFVAMVADGVGGLESGEEASATALEAVLHYLGESTDCYYRAEAGTDEFERELVAAAMRAHQAVKDRAAADGHGQMATTLTIYMGVWPTYYLVQVGDSRYYLYRDGTLTQVSRDQTVAQDLVDRGVLTAEAAQKTKLAHVLSSAIGGDEATPVVTRLRSEWGTAHLMCSDGLTKHVSDARIAEVLGSMTSAKQAAEQLLQEALDGGGSDNITIVVGRTAPKPGRG
ncbi:protein phosphatase 2C domain-containing protein [Pseudogemmatithrix spongiicola]|uniref:Protein phosphatase 2C domain-containing protein n=1 Tax=Pseudogemmatithrix spongiicola TaxID=3062599 RepID=A0AA49JTC4_9BACT|nr:protein phosphatase 2C domain-containing protein [Gemmatimonadaceae bacterium 'strain 138']WKW14450.1 protein phosphatase 2C domain-containing protein [Gemmatimonadaceae bacterium 'strain 318']